MPIANDEIVVSNLVLTLQLSALHYGDTVAARYHHMLVPPPPVKLGSSPVVPFSVLHHFLLSPIYTINSVSYPTMSLPVLNL